LISSVHLQKSHRSHWERGLRL